MAGTAGAGAHSGGGGGGGHPRIAVLGGTGNVGFTLASKLAAAGWPVILASSDPTSEKAVAALAAVSGKAAAGVSVTADKPLAATAAADVIIVALPAATTAAAIAEYAALIADGGKGKVVIDVINPIGPSFAIELHGITSVGEELAKLLPTAHVAKAFNTIGAAHMADPIMADGKPIDMLWAGPAAAEAAAAHKVVSDVVAAVGFHPVYVGPIRAARNLEAIAELWIHASYKYKTLSNFGFAVVTK